MLSTPAQFLPLILFSIYAFWDGQPTNDRWLRAFMLGGVAAAIHSVLLLRGWRPANRLALGANIYLLIGGVAAVGRQWWLLDIYGRLNETGIFLSMFVVGVVATTITRAGFIGVESTERESVRRYSVWLLGATVVATAASIVFQGAQTWSSVVPMLGLALIHRTLAHRLSETSGASK